MTFLAIAKSHNYAIMQASDYHNNTENQRSLALLPDQEGQTVHEKLASPNVSKSRQSTYATSL